MAKDKDGKKYEPPPDPLENKKPAKTTKNEQPRSSDPRRKGF